MMGPIGIIIRESNRNMAEIKSRIKNSKQKIENLNEEVRQETNYLAFLRRLEKAEEDLGEAEKIKNENAKQISILTAKVSSYEKKLKSRDSLLKKMDTKMNEMKNENAADISDLIYFYESSMKFKKMEALKTANRKLKIKLSATNDELDHIRYALSYTNSLRFIFQLFIIRTPLNTIKIL